tara:strand:- start:362 stop:1579 length:1218 start_codon:yes stop_codon:yes gene_type:complete
MNLIINKYFLPNTLCLFIALLPVAILSGSLVINIFHILISVIFLVEIYKEKKIEFFNDYFFYLLLFLWLSFLINLFFSTIPENGISRSVGFLRFILLIFAIKYVFLYEKEKYKKLILNVWLVVFIIVTLDLFFEFYFGRNTLGFTSYMPGRLAGFLNDELKIGGYYLGFGLISIATLYNSNEKKSYLIPILIIIFIIASFLIGERSNFIKFFTIIFLFTIVIYKKKILNYLVVFITLILVLYGLLLKNENLKYRYLDQINYSKISESLYFQHYKSAISVYKENPYFGVGIKNFRNEIVKEKYISNKDWNNRHIISTHPHQINFEILTETGIFGFLCYLIFFLLSFFKTSKIYFKNKNVFLLSALLFCLIYLNPILPSGSFFTTYSATIFWMNFALMITFAKYIKK